MDSKRPSSSATRSADVIGASLGAPLLPLAGLPALDALAGAPPPEGPPLAEALCWALADELLAEELLGALLEALALLEDELLDEELLDELDEALLLAVCCSSEKSISSGGSPSLLEEGSGGMRESSGGRSESLYT
ncbi:hypothetical protein PVT68_07490 [Microbulbifer bruguierae]|uniref:Secreted protein n=1 Tax=Microbulbifer bruguierae TaxID=3029061 RepID=A0ABY8NHF4_9GAMM|nr:hypothetical protein [Microbulbifer bruguierae]WGL18130.1 hypothetical protein PVT68_07490 [Microbulbifer bruguierae]